MNKLKRKPTVENKYNLTLKDIRNMKVDRSKLKEPLFWRNNVINAWCVSGNTAKSNAEREFCTYNEYWLGVYDVDSKTYAGKLRVDFNSYGGMCGYKFEKFYQPKDIENEMDLKVQEMFLEKIHELINKGVLILDK